MRKGYKDKDKGKRRLLLNVLLFLLLLAAGAVAALLFLRQRWEKPEDLLKTYMGYIEEGNYHKMYEMLDQESSGAVEEETFVERNANIYEGIEAENMEITILGAEKNGREISYQCSFDTAAGKISFSNRAEFVRSHSGYRLVWRDGLIFPGLEEGDKVRISSQRAKRGKILDRNGNVMAGEGSATSVGIVPEQTGDMESTVIQLAALLEMDRETILQKLSASWVREDFFVPIKTISGEKGPEVTDMLLGEAFHEPGSLEDTLMKIPGVMLQEVKVRSYPMGEAAAHLVGYVQTVTAEDLEKHPGEGYEADSVIGRSGMESLYEKELKGQNGYKIWIEDSTGVKKELLAVKAVEDGKDVRLTIDGELQELLYREFQEDKSCSVAMDPCTGEVLALVSTPSYDNNAFVIGMTEKQWNTLNEDENRPMYNRFRQTWSPGSVLKPIIGGIGTELGAIEPERDYGSQGLSWQEDGSWGDYYVTTLHEYAPVTLENALVYSDNIYFAQAALRIGRENLETALKELGFGEEIPFEIVMTPSQYSNTESIESRIQLANSGYGQGQILMNPLHLASLYTAFSNKGDVIRPTLLYEENAQPEIWLPGIFSEETTEKLRQGLIQVINNSDGTGYGLHREDLTLAGKTGTAEIKATTEDTDGTELGWLAVFTADDRVDRQVLLVTMTEDVKERGGSGYVVEKISGVLEGWCIGLG